MKFVIFSALLLPAVASAQPVTDLKTLVDDTIQPLMKQQQIPGMAVAVLWQGKGHFFQYGQADISSKRPVTDHTLFELGSVSKTFTGVLSSYAQQAHWVNFDDPVSRYFPQLTGKQWQGITMIHLATYTAGGLPLQVPDNVTDQPGLTHFYNTWQPQWAPGSKRLYSNASIGLFGALAVKNEHVSFEQVMKTQVFAPMQLSHTFITVPQRAMPDYAWGYKQGKAVRVTPGMLDAEAYGVKSTSRDMLRFMQLNANPQSLPTPLQRAIKEAQTAYFKSDYLYQGLGWEMIDYPMDPQAVIAASANEIALKPQAVERLNPPRSPRAASWVHKTGSTNGFGAYIAFIPEQQIGIVMLANKSYPNPARVTAAYTILHQLASH